MFKIISCIEHSLHTILFTALVAQEMDWLDKLERRLKKSPKSAADAEEISEELDVSTLSGLFLFVLSLFCAILILVLNGKFLY